MDEVNEFTWFKFELNSKTQDKPTQPEEKPPEKTQLVLQAIDDYAHEKILIVGSPGAGKSTLLTRILWQAAERAQQDETAPIPVLVELKLYDEPGIWGLIQTALGNSDLDLEIPEIKQLIKDQRLLLLADGFNELPTDRARAEFRKFCGRNIPVIVTSRDAADNLGLERKLDLQPPSSQQVAWFLEERLPNSDRSQLQKLGDRVRDLGQTPLMIWMLYSIFQAKHEIPETRGEAYRTFTTLYTERAKEGIDLTESRFILSKLAFEMMQSPKLDDPTDFQLDIPEVDAQVLLGSEKTLKRLVDFHLLQWQGKPGNRKIRFCHQSLQEYYAAECLLQQLQHLSDVDLQRQYLNYLKWTEAIALMLGLADKDQAVRVVELAIGVDLMLGARLAGEVKPQLQKQTVKLINALEVTEILRIELLGDTGSEVAIAALSKTLEDPDLIIRFKAVDALEKIGSEQAITSINKVLPTRRMVNSILEEMRNKQTTNLPNKILEHKNLSNPLSVAQSLKTPSGAKTIAQLDKDLENEDHNIRWNAVQTLGNINDEQKMSLLVKALEDKENSICQAAVELLGSIGNEQAVASLSKMLKHQDPEIQMSAAAALGHIGGEQVITLLSKTLEDEDKDLGIRIIAAVSLGMIGNASLLMKLWQMECNGTVDCLKAIASIQARCKFYNYEIFQAALEPENSQTENQEKTTNVYHISTVGNLNTGTVNVQRDQIGTQHNSDGKA